MIHDHRGFIDIPINDLINLKQSRVIKMRRKIPESNSLVTTVMCRRRPSSSQKESPFIDFLRHLLVGVSDTPASSRSGFSRSLLLQTREHTQLWSSLDIDSLSGLQTSHIPYTSQETSRNQESMATQNPDGIPTFKVSDRLDNVLD